MNWLAVTAVLIGWVAAELFIIGLWLNTEFETPAAVEAWLRRRRGRRL